jgi:hypothetical protein
MELYLSALAIFEVTKSLSLKKKAIRTRVRTMSIRDPRPGVFSRARF